MSMAFSFTPRPPPCYSSSSINKSVPSFSISPSSIRFNFSFTPSLPPSFRIHRHKGLPFVLHSIDEGSFGGGEDCSSKKRQLLPNQEVKARKAQKTKADDTPASNPTGNYWHQQEEVPPQKPNKKGVSSRDDRANKERTVDLLISVADALRKLGDHLLSD